MKFKAYYPILAIIALLFIIPLILAPIVDPSTALELNQLSAQDTEVVNSTGSRFILFNDGNNNLLMGISDDGGDNWRNSSVGLTCGLQNSGPTDTALLLINSSDDLHVFCGRRSSASKIQTVTSVDSGATFSSAVNVVSLGQFNMVMSGAINGNDDIVLCLAQIGDNKVNVYNSTDSGASWTATNDVFSAVSIDQGCDVEADGNNMWHLTAGDISNDEIAYTNTTDPTSWETPVVIQDEGTLPQDIDIVMAINPTNEDIYIATVVGVSGTTYKDDNVSFYNSSDGDTWTRTNVDFFSGFGILEIDMVVDDNGYIHLFAAIVPDDTPAIAGNITYTNSTDGGLTWIDPVTLVGTPTGEANEQKWFNVRGSRHPSFNNVNETRFIDYYWYNDTSNIIYADYIDGRVPSIEYGAVTTADATNQTNADIFVNVTVAEEHESNITFRIYYSNGTLVNASTFTDSTRTINFTGLSDNTYNFNVTVVDTSNQMNTTSTRSVTIDSTNPNIDFTTGTPASSTNQSNTNIFVNVSVTEINEDSIVFLLYNSTSQVNSTSFTDSTRTINFTGLADEVYSFNVTVNDSAGNTNTTSTRFITIDTVNPSILITTPSNNTNSTNTGLDVNYTISDTNLGSCWYSNDSMTVNNTLSGCSNITSVTWAEGPHNVTVWANDSAGNENKSSISFTIDTTGPAITIDVPSDSQEFDFNTSINLNFTASDSLGEVSACWYSIDDVENITIANCQNTTFNTSDGSHTLDFYSNDSLNNVATLSRSFTVSLDAPAITLNYPANNTFFNTNTNIYLNYTASDPNGLDTCQIWHDFNGSFSLNESNSGVTSGLQNYSVFNISSDNQYYWNVWCNDTTGSSKFAANNFTFTTDTIAPNLTIDNIATTPGSQNVKFNHTAQDTNLGSCWYSIYNSSGQIDNSIENQSMTCNTNNIQFTVSLESGTFNLTLYSNDSADNLNTTTSSFTVSEASAGGGGGGGGGGTTEVAPVVSLNIPDGFNKTMVPLKRAIIYKEIQGAKTEVTGLFAITLPQVLIDQLLDKLKDQGISMTQEELELWLDSFEEGKIEILNLNRDDINKYGLIISTGTYCGDLICQRNGNSAGLQEDFFICPQDCPGFNPDSTVFYCFDNDETTYCIWDDVKYTYVSMTLLIVIFALSFSTVKDKETRKQIPLYQYVLSNRKKR